jgi:hypothetical protein
MSTTPNQIVAELAVLAQTLGPLLPPNARLAVTLALTAMHAVQAAQDRGRDVTSSELDALFAADDQAKADDLLAQQAAALNSSPKP